MTVFLPILVCLCGGVGASCRYLLDATIKTYWQRAFPLSTFTINLIAHTLEVTTLNRLHVGAKVNLEVDLIARYVERMLNPEA